MKLSLRWLEDYVDLPTQDPDQLAAVLGGLGFEVEGLDRLEVPFSGVVVAQVQERRAHPDADRLQLVRVSAGERDVEVVCGAWNFEVGAVVPLALPGAVLSGGLRVGERQIRGVRSVGMICSEAELGLGENADGIMVLDEGVPIGVDFAQQLPYPDVVFDLAITTNRPDAMSMVGLARELAANYGVALRLPEISLSEKPPQSRVEVRIDDPVGCPRYVAREVRGVRVGPSPLWLQLRLRAGGLRPINNVVDATNYVLLELGQPLHAFDLELLADQTIVVRRAQAGERLRTLEGVERELYPEDLVIADSRRAVALAGVIGGEETEVGGGTTRVLIESAYFDPPTVMLTAKRHGVRTEASARFERGVDPAGALRAADRAAQLMGTIAGAQAAQGVRDVYPKPVEPVEIVLPLSEVSRLLGIELEAESVADLLRRLELEVGEGDPLRVRVPSFRPDLTRPADLVEEVARLYGYDNIPETLPAGVGGGLTSEQRRLRVLRHALVGAGYWEAHTFSFLGSQDLDRLGLAADDPRRRAVRVSNPLREEEALLRTSLLPGLLKALAYNRARRLTDVALFEVGKVFFHDGDAIPEQPDQVAFVATGSRSRPPHEFPREVDGFDASGTWETLADVLRLENWKLRPSAAAPFHPGRAAEVLVEGEPIGTVGELHPRVAGAFQLEDVVIAGELMLGRLLTEPPWWQLQEPSPFPPVVFDLAFELDQETPAGDLLAEVRAVGGGLLESVQVFDVFSGGPLPEGRKSLAIRLTMRAPDHTLSDEELAPVRKAIAEAVAERFGGRLRGG